MRAKFLDHDQDVAAKLKARASYGMRSWNGIEVGKVRCNPAF
jgi:L-asparaginase II